MNDMTTLVRDTAFGKITEANGIAETIASSRVNVNKMFHDWRDAEDTDDERVRKFQAFKEDILSRLEQAENSLREIFVTEVAKTSAMSDEEYEAAKARHAALRSEITQTIKFLEMQPGGKEAAESLPAVLGISGRKTGSGTGSSGPRPRLTHATVNGDDVSKDGKVTFTILAQHITKDAGVKVGPRDLQEAAFETAGTTDLSTVNEVSFGYSANGNNYTVTVFPKGADADNESEDNESE